VNTRDQALFSLMVVMAIVTTVMAGPLLPVLSEVAAAHRVLVLVDDPANQWEDVALAGALAAAQRSGEVVLSRLLPYRTAAMEVGTGLSGELLEMTRSMTELERLAGRVRRAEVPASVLSRFTDDVERDVLAQIAASVPSTVMVHAARPGLAAIRAAVTGRLVIVGSGPVAPPSVVAVRWRKDSAAALEVATAVAVARGLPLVIDDGKRPGRRATAMAAELTEYGVSASAEVAPADALVVAADAEEDEPPAGARVAVRAAKDAQVRPVAQWVLPEAASV
jgi:hypothetical protein